MIKIHHLRDYVAIAEAGSVHGAARALGLAQPGVSRSVRELERYLGAPLLERQARGISLTPVGQAFLTRAKVVLAELRRGTEEAAQLSGASTATVSVGLSSAVVISMLPYAYPEFRKSYPAARVRVTEGMFTALEPRLREGDLDFYIGPRPNPTLSAPYHVQLLFRNERQVVGRRGHPLRSVLSLRDLIDAEWVFTGLRERAEQEFEEQFTVHKLPAPQAITQADSMLGILSLVNSTDSLVFLPRQWVDSPMLKQWLEPIPIEETLMGPDIVQITRNNPPLTPAAERFATLMMRFTA